jgi:hypothetical protein
VDAKRISKYPNTADRIDPVNTPSLIGASNAECSKASEPINKLMVKPTPHNKEMP